MPPTVPEMSAFLHIGLMKTGTTSIQMSMLRNAARLLEERNICYPTIAGNHWPGLLPFLRQDRFQPVENYLLRGRGSQTDLDHLGDRFVREIEAAAVRGNTLVISSEQLPMLVRDSLRALRDHLVSLGFHPRIVVYVRHPLERLSSKMSQRIGGGHDSLDSYHWVDDVVPALTLFGEVFGRNNLDVRRFDPSHFPDGELMSDFMAALGQLPMLGLETLRLNERLSAPAIALADRLFTVVPLASGRRGLDRYFARIPGPRFLAPREVAAQVLVQCLPALDILDREFGIAFEPVDLDTFPVGRPTVAPPDLTGIADLLLTQSRRIDELTAKHVPQHTERPTSLWQRVRRLASFRPTRFLRRHNS